MTVADLMKVLATMPADAVVRFPDTYEENEGWGECDPYCVVGGATFEDGKVTLYEGDEYEDEDEDEEYEDEE